MLMSKRDVSDAFKILWLTEDGAMIMAIRLLGRHLSSKRDAWKQLAQVIGGSRGRVGGAFSHPEPESQIPDLVAIYLVMAFGWMRYAMKVPHPSEMCQEAL